MARRRNVSLKERERFDRVVAPPQQQSSEQRRLSVSLTVICAAVVLLLLTALVFFFGLFVFVNYHHLIPHHSLHELDLSSCSHTGDEDAVVNLDQ